MCCSHHHGGKVNSVSANSDKSTHPLFIYGAATKDGAISGVYNNSSNVTTLRQPALTAFWQRSQTKKALILLAIIAGISLALGQTGHLSFANRYLPYALFLLCPLMHLFHAHGNHGNHGKPPR
ncbi:DUF2933 domain-containing protein [Acerihabitans sp. KWT182]|uniref:DUF2933 domain-containing protein n=1 Tax=Acerihabitans sp. KWT182 TaxID=3157919 RepID=A0AAU7QDT5_9GAMM